MQEVHSLPVIDDNSVIQRVITARAEKEVRDVLFVVRWCSRNLAEAARIGVTAGFRIEVVDLRVDRLILPSRIQTVPSSQQRVTEFRVDHCRVLELRIATLNAERGVAADGLSVQAARKTTVRRIVRH